MAKKSKGSGQRNSYSILKKRQQKQQEKQDRKRSKQVRFSNQNVLVDSNNKAHHQQLQASAGSHVSFGEDQVNYKDQEQDQQQQQSINASNTSNSSKGRKQMVFDSSQTKVQQLNVSKYRPSQFTGELDAENLRCSLRSCTNAIS